MHLTTTDIFRSQYQLAVSLKGKYTHDSPKKLGKGGGVVLALCSTKCTWSRLICTLLRMQVSSSIYIVINIEIMHLMTTDMFMYQHWPCVGLTRWLDREGRGWVQLLFC